MTTGVADRPPPAEPPPAEPPPAEPPSAEPPSAEPPAPGPPPPGPGNGKRPPRSRTPAPSTAATRAASWALVVVAGLALWMMLFGFVLSGLVEAHAQHDLYNQFRLELAQGVAPTGGAISEGDPVAVINSSAAHLHDVVVVEGTSSRALRSGPGHEPGDPLPGQLGVVVLMGRSTSYGAPFAHITALHAGDVVDLTTGQGLFHYTVEDVRRPGDTFPPPLAANGSQLTLITSEGSGWQTGWAPGNAVFVDAVLSGAAAPTSAGHGVPTMADGVLHGDTRGMYPLVLWLQLLVIAVVGGIWAKERWGRPQTWLVAGPIVLAGLWGASTNVWLLLPNLF